MTEHLEDEVLNNGVEGTRGAINFLRSLRDMLAGNSKSSVNVTVKWDGCVHEDTKIVTDKGNIPIKELIERIESGEDVAVIGRDLNSSTPMNETVHVENTSVSENDKSWVEVTLENGSSFILTEDHEVYTTNRGWVQAKDLTEEDDILEL